MTYVECPSWAKALYRHAKKNAAKRGIAFELDREAFAEHVAMSTGRCTLTGIAFDLSARSANRVTRPLAPSIDRIRNDLGYTAANVRLVCVAVNLALNHWGEAVLRDIARGLLGIGDPADAAWAAAGRQKYPSGVTAKYGKRRTTYRANVDRKHVGCFATPEEAAAAVRIGYFLGRGDLIKV